MKIAVVGAGLAGVAVVWFLLNQIPHQNFAKITLFDEKGIGSGASGVAAGLLHPYAGAHAKLNWRGLEGFAATVKLLAISSQHLQSPVTAQDLGVLRLACTEKQQLDFQKSPAILHQNASWLSASETELLYSHVLNFPSLWIKNGLTVYCTSYLEGLWMACQKRNADFIQKRIHSISDLKDFDLIILTTGAQIKEFKECSHLPISTVKGQLLELSWPTGFPPLPFALNSQAYIVMKPSASKCLIGSTYERDFQNLEVDMDKATAEIFPKIAAILPFLYPQQITNGYAGLRAFTPTHRPFFSQVSSNTWILTGFGSKGLLYHALLAQELVKHIFSSTFSLS